MHLWGCYRFFFAVYFKQISQKKIGEKEDWGSSPTCSELVPGHQRRVASVSKVASLRLCFERSLLTKWVTSAGFYLYHEYRMELGIINEGYVQLLIHFEFDSCDSSLDVPFFYFCLG
jgi:hypothetical protein